MKKSDINSMPEYFDRYINLVADVELSQAFDDSIAQLNKLDKNLLAKLDGKKYAPDKWTVKEIFQHVIDFERILSYRTLLFLPDAKARFRNRLTKSCSARICVRTNARLII